jgi:hypothetical protein
MSTDPYWTNWIADLVRDACRDALQRGGVSEADARRIAEAQAEKLRADRLHAERK